jgi:hypothetical protein
VVLDRDPCGIRRFDPVTGRKQRLSASTFGEKFFNGQADIPSNLSKERRGDVPARVKRHRRRAAIGMSVLLVGTTLSNLFETVALKVSNHFPWLQNRYRAHY